MRTGRLLISVLLLSSLWPVVHSQPNWNHPKYWRRQCTTVKLPSWHFHVSARSDCTAHHVATIAETDKALADAYGVAAGEILVLFMLGYAEGCDG